ncbi:unnamed protein product [Cercopithifilaria johnstoni]|uniref:Uncharacterized protein n=1 Tax=Cercopithifilaria johnstoni TaxID=2874296 RepID=A0A8J2MNS8_9BILA|nr:unnamed protein product [Cercopithifilaria johnstoni]
MAGLGNDVFGGGKEGADGGGGGTLQALTQGGTAGTYNPNYQTMAGLGNHVFGEKGGGSAKPGNRYQDNGDFSAKPDNRYQDNGDFPAKPGNRLLGS